MNRRSILGVSAVTALGLAVMPGSAVSQQKSLKEQLVGTWTLVSQENAAPNGTKRQPFGANPNGILILDVGGQYANVLGSRDRPKLKSRNRLESTPADFGVAAMGFAANFGTWSVNEADKTLSRRYQAALVPNNEGMEIKNSISLVGDELKLTDAAAAAGGTTVSVYRRAK
jgi:hypothetical protein